MIDDAALPEESPSATMNYLKPRGLLYHYTDVEGFLGILDSDSLYATHIRYLNDSREFIDALEHAEGLTDALVDEFDRCKAELRRSLASAGEPFSGKFEELRTDLKAGLKEFLSSISPRVAGRFGAYVVSFTDDSAQEPASGGNPGDRLSQWRAYCGAGRGISLGFDFEALHGKEPGKSWVLDGCVAYLVNCIYDAESKRANLKTVADLVIPSVRKFWETGSIPEYCEEHESSFAAFRQQTLLVWIMSASTFKDPAFAEEKEWRVVILGRGDKGPMSSKGAPDMAVKFRNGPLGITPYLHFPLRLSSPSSPLRRIVIGPTPHMQESIKAVEMILEDRGMTLRSEEHPDGIEVFSSLIPYRDW